VVNGTDNGKEPLVAPAVVELASMKALIIDCVNGENDFHRLKEHVRFTLGIAGESMEMQQIHSFMLENEKDLDTLRKQLEKLEKTNGMILKALAVVGSLLSALLGKIGLDVLGPGFEAFIRALLGG